VAEQGRTPRWGLGAFVLVELTYLLVAFSFSPLFAHRQRTAPLLALAIVVPTLVAAGLAMLITRLRGNGPRVDLRLQWSARGLGLGLLFGFGGLFLTVPASMIYVRVVGPNANSAAGAMFGTVRTSWPWAVVVFLIATGVAPFCEEVIFRGLLWGALERRWGRWVALTVSTVVFAVAHLELTRMPLLLVVAIPIALARLYSGGLLASIVAHQVTNLLPGVIIMLGLVGAT
jgi:membrane protease YdiL (CAAX protease family)